MKEVVFGVLVDGELAEFKSNPTNLFPSAEEADKARSASKDEKVKNGEIVAFRLSKTIIV